MAGMRFARATWSNPHDHCCLCVRSAYIPSALKSVPLAASKLCMTSDSQAVEHIPASHDVAKLTFALDVETASALVEPWKQNYEETGVFFLPPFKLEDFSSVATPDEILQQAKEVKNSATRCYVDPSSRFLVKIAFELQFDDLLTLHAIRAHFGDEVPVPQPYGMLELGNDTLMYMEFVKGQTIEDISSSIRLTPEQCQSVGDLQVSQLVLNSSWRQVTHQLIRILKKLRSATQVGQSFVGKFLLWFSCQAHVIRAREYQWRPHNGR
jgi:hypothetical protein